MVDRQKVLKGLECCLKSWNGACDPECPYNCECRMNAEVFQTVMRDALELLKEQQETIASFQGTIYKLNAELEKQPEIIQCGDCQCMSTSPYKPSCWKNRRRGDDGNWFCADGERL